MQIYSKSMKNATSPLFRNHNRSALPMGTYITHRVIYYPLVCLENIFIYEKFSFVLGMSISCDIGINMWMSIMRSVLPQISAVFFRSSVLLSVFENYRFEIILCLILCSRSIKISLYLWFVLSLSTWRKSLVWAPRTPPLTKYFFPLICHYKKNHRENNLPALRQPSLSVIDRSGAKRERDKVCARVGGIYMHRATSSDPCVVYCVYMIVYVVYISMRVESRYT